MSLSEGFKKDEMITHGIWLSARYVKPAGLHERAGLRDRTQ